jgi:hypothetical protein
MEIGYPTAAVPSLDGRLKSRECQAFPHFGKPMLTSISTLRPLPTPSIVPRLEACRPIVSMVLRAQAPRNTPRSGAVVD